MNFGVVMLALLLVCGVSLGLAAMSGASPGTYVDSYGTVPSPASNITQTNMTGSQIAPLSDAAGGLILLFAFFFVIIAVAFLAGALSKKSYGQGRR